MLVNSSIDSKTHNAREVPSDLPGQRESIMSQEEEVRYPYLH